MVPIESGGASILAATDGYRVTFHKGSDAADVLLVTFGTMLSGLTNEGFGTQYAKKKGYDHIYVAQAPDSWYQQLSRQEFSAVVRDLAAGYDRVFTYGSSLGGYAALYFASVIDAQVVAGSPINWAHPILASEEWRHVEFAHEDLANLPAPSQPPVILYDPMRASDRLFVETLIAPSVDGSRIVRLPFSGHAVFVSLRSRGVLDEFLDNIFRENQLIALEPEEPGSYIYHLNMAEYYLDKGDKASAEKEFVESLNCNFNRIAAARLAKMMSSQKRFKELRSLEKQGFKALGNTDFLKGLKLN